MMAMWCSPVARCRLRGHGCELGTATKCVWSAISSSRPTVACNVPSCRASWPAWRRGLMSKHSTRCATGYGVQKSSVSRHWQAASMERLREFQERPLGNLDLVALVIDGLEFQEYLLVVALGIDAAGRKHVLGMWPGATENATVSKHLLDDLEHRGLPTDRRYLVVIDGSKALAKAVRSKFGAEVLLQRCQVHKNGTSWSICRRNIMHGSGNGFELPGS
jgi:Transposase, Mutator family